VLSENPSITWECIQSNPYIKWDYSYISQNPNITWDIIYKNKDKFIYCDKEISGNPNISWDIVTSSSKQIAWDYASLASNPAITFHDIYDSLIHRDGESVMKQRIPNSNISFVWCWYGLSKNPNVTWEMIQSEDDEFKDVKWNNYFLCMNPNINMKIIKENPQFHYYTIISKNKMEYYPWHLVKSLSPEPYILK
jgi:hypothetical protein